jgi:hypothetical protein
MIKLVATKTDQTKVVLLVLEEGNIVRLKRMQPIEVKLHDLIPGFPKCEVAIMYSYNLADTEKQIRENFSIGQIIDTRGDKK